MLFHARLSIHEMGFHVCSAGGEIRSSYAHLILNDGIEIGCNFPYADNARKFDTQLLYMNYTIHTDQWRTYEPWTK
jgi:hypothetical protein